MGGVFVNYRTGDGDWAATLIARELSARLGSENVFFASKSIRAGEDFATQIFDRLRTCDVLLTVIGSQWLAATDRQGRRRLDTPDDWVRREITEAFRYNLRVIPVFLDGASTLSEADLPDDIGVLARCQYLRLHHRNDDRDLARLIDEVAGQADDEHRRVVVQLRQVLSDPGRKVALHDIVHDATTQALDVLVEARYPISRYDLPDSDIPAALQQRLQSYERDMAQLLRLVATGVHFGDDRHDELWIRTVDRVLNRHGGSSSSRHDPWAPAEAYPALMLTYVLGVAGMATGREDLVYRQLALVKVRVPGRPERPAIRALALRHVVDPKHAAAFPKWNGSHYHHALSVHLRQVLHPVFHDLLDDHEYERAFEEYEYLRSLLEFHDAAFGSLGEFAFSLDKGRTTVDQRMSARLTSGSALLQAGAFDGDVANVAKARLRLDVSIRGRYRS